MALATDVQKNIKERFTHVYRVRFADLKYELYQLNQNSLLVINFFIETSVLMEEFENYHLMPQRPCPIPCSCEAM